MASDRGAPIAYLVLEEGTPVETADGQPYGEVKRVLAEPNADLFDGLIIDTPDGDRFVDAPNVAEIYERAVILSLGAQDVQHLPEPSASPAALNVTPDDVAGDTPGDTVRETLKRAWDRISGKY